MLAVKMQLGHRVRVVRKMNDVRGAIRYSTNLIDRSDTDGTRGGRERLKDQVVGNWSYELTGLSRV